MHTSQTAVSEPWPWRHLQHATEICVTWRQCSMRS